MDRWIPYLMIVLEDVLRQTSIAFSSLTGTMVKAVKAGNEFNETLRRLDKMRKEMERK